MNIEISAIVVTYNSQNEIQACIESLYNNTKRALEVFIVDNCSTDKTVEIVRALQGKYSTLELIVSKQNVGLAVGNNKPIDRLKGEYTLVVNPDAQAMDYSIDKILQKLTSVSNIGMVGPLCLSDGFTYHSSFHRRFGLFHILAWRIFPYSLMRRLYDDILRSRIKEGKVDFVSGEFFIARTEIYRKLGGYDPHYFLSICDVADLAIKFKKVGLINYFYPDAKIFHPGGKSNNQVKLLTQIKGVDGELYYLYKNKSRLSAQIARYAFLLYYSVRKGFFVINYRFFSKSKGVFTKLKIAHMLVNYLKGYKFVSPNNETR